MFTDIKFTLKLNAVITEIVYETFGKRNIILSLGGIKKWEIDISTAIRFLYLS